LANEVGSATTPGSERITGNTGSAESTDDAINTSNAINLSTDNPASMPATKSHNESLNGSGQSQDTLTRQEQARLHSLKAMLDASNARYKKATRNRRPKFSAGLQILIVSGDHTGKTGVVLDADYIANRALISLSDQESPHWIAFQSLGHAD